MDRAVALLGRYFDLTLSMECRFNHALDADRLARATRLCLDAEPVLGCRWEPGDPVASWVRVPTEQIEGLYNQVTTDSEFEAARRSMILPEQGVQLRVIHKPGGSDRLLVQVHHHAADAGGVKETVAILADIYTTLGSEPDYQPVPNITGSRELDQVTRHVPWYAWPRIQLNHLAEVWRKIYPKRTHALIVGGQGSREQGIESAAPVLHRIESDRVEQLKDWGRTRDATLNDILIGAFLRAQAGVVDWDGKSAFRLTTTIDHRIHSIPARRGEAVANLSAFEFYSLGRKLGADIEETVRRVAARTRRRKKSWFGMNSYVLEVPIYRLLSDRRLLDGGEKIVEMGIRSDNVPNGLTNMGPISPEQVRFDHPAEDAFLIAPLARRVLFLGGITGYNGTLTISGGAPDNFISGTTTAAFFNRLLDELPE